MPKEEEKSSQGPSLCILLQWASIGGFGPRKSGRAWAWLNQEIYAWKFDFYEDKGCKPDNWDYNAIEGYFQYDNEWEKVHS